MRFDIIRLGDYKKNNEIDYSILRLIISFLSILGFSHLRFKISSNLKLCKNYFIVTIFARLNYADFDLLSVSLNGEAVE